MHEVEKRTDVWLVFAGMLELPISRNALNVFTKASQDGIETIHFLTGQCVVFSLLLRCHFVKR